MGIRAASPTPRELPLSNWAWFWRGGLPISGGDGTDRYTPVMLHVDYARWDQTPEDLRRLAMSAAHQRTRERFLALYEVTQQSCATRIAVRTRRHPQTVMGWVHAYNAQGPAALAYRHTGGRRPFFARPAKPNSARWSARPSARRPPAL